MTAKPTTITAAEFIDNGYAAKIAAGECVVNHHFPMDLFKVTDVYEMPFRSKVTGTNLRIEYVDIDDDPCDILPDEQLTVTWLAQADAKPDSGARVGGNAQVEADQGIHAMCIAERERNEALEKDFATVRDLLLGIKKEAEWVATNKGLDIEASPIYQWTKQILALSSPGKIIVDEIEQLRAELANAKAEAEALRTALEAIANKSDPEKPIRLDGETGTSYGRTYGQWEMAKIAREALQAGTEGG